MRNPAWLFCCALAVYLLVLAGLYVFQRQMIFLTTVGGIITTPPDAPQPFENFDTVTMDGIDLRGWYKKAAPGFATIVYFHGNADNLGKTLHYHDLLVNKGFGLLLTSYRGYSGHKGRPSEEGLYKDAQAYIDALIASGVPEKDIVIYGFSLGSGVAAEMALCFPNAKALVLGAPFTTLADAAAYKYPYIPVGLLMQDKFDNLSKIKNVTMPTLVVNGLDDEVFPTVLGKTLADAGPVALVTFQQKPGTHVGFFFDHGGDVAIAEWLSRFGPLPAQ